MPLEYFLIKVEQPNEVEWWTRYYRVMQRIALNVFDAKMKYEYGQAIIGGIDILKAKAEASPLQVWMAIAAESKFSAGAANFAEIYPKIVMCMTVSTAEGVPFSTHMGIFRSPLWNKSMYADGRKGDIEEFLQEPETWSPYTEIGEIVKGAIKDPPQNFHENSSSGLHAAAAELIAADLGKKYMINYPRKNVHTQLVEKCGGCPIYIYGRKNETHTEDLVIEVASGKGDERTEIAVISAANRRVLNYWLRKGNYLDDGVVNREDVRPINVAVPLSNLQSPRK